MSSTAPTVSARPVPPDAGAPDAGHSRWSLGIGLAFLTLGFLVDLVQFREVIGRAVPGLDDRSIWLIAVGAGAVALYMMVEAGRLEARRRLGAMGRHGRGVVRLVVGLWLFLGLVATYIRLSVAPQAAATGGFGSTATAVTEVWHLGPLTLYPAEVPMALLMLALYLAVGVGAFLFGLHSYHPFLSDKRRRQDVDLRQARQTEVQRRRKLHRMAKARDEQADRLLRLRQQQVETQQLRQGMHAHAALDGALQSYHSAAAQDAELSAEATRLREELALINAELETLDTTTDSRRDLADALGVSAQRQARARLHQHLAEPTRPIPDRELPTHVPNDPRQES